MDDLVQFIDIITSLQVLISDLCGNSTWIKKRNRRLCNVSFMTIFPPSSYLSKKEQRQLQLFLIFPPLLERHLRWLLSSTPFMLKAISHVLNWRSIVEAQKISRLAYCLGQAQLSSCRWLVEKNKLTYARLLANGFFNLRLSLAHTCFLRQLTEL